MLSLIAVIGKNRELGKNNKLLWHVPGDLPRFKKITLGHPVIMGRKTFESIGKPLSDRTNIVITNNTSFDPAGVIVVSSVEEALEKAKVALGHDEIFVIGGGNVFAQTMSYADRLYLTIVDAESTADTFFPDFSRFNTIVSEEQHDENDFYYKFVILEP